jgi:hypothetical protein
MRLNFVGMVSPTQRSHNLEHREIHTRQHNVIFNTDIQLTSGKEYQGTFYCSILQELSEK